MINIEEKSTCSGCGACQNVCPKSCIVMESDNEGFLYPSINKEVCIQCNQCERICPILNKLNVNNVPQVFAVHNTDMNIRLKSSSGGVFYFLAEKVVMSRGVVFGAAFDENLMVRHKYVENKEDIHQLMGSKYVQSFIGNTYQKVLEFLNVNRLVLFSGTPCQIAGLRAYLKKDYDNLITVDIICHGVPSPQIWRDYVDGAEKSKGKISSVSFRNKDKGWSQFQIEIKYKNGSKFCQAAKRNKYMRGFLSNLYLRPSCHSCSFKGEKRFSDITMADFWGIENIEPNIENDNTGISMVLVNSIKGKEFLEIGATKKLIYREIKDVHASIKENSAAIESVKINQNRELFFEDYKKHGLEYGMKKYCKYSIRKELWLMSKIALYRILLKFGVIKR